MQEAIAAEFYLEASWIAYAILEDRLIAAMLSTGGATDKKGKPVKMMGPKITILKKRRQRDKLLDVNFPQSWLDDLTRWTDRRNKLMHTMADATVNFARLQRDAKKLAITGDPLVFDACRQTRRLRKHRHQVSIPKKPFPYNK